MARARSALLALAASTLATGCAGPSDDGATVLPPLAPPARSGSTPAATQPVPTAGFTPLPTPQQVVAPLATGRPDPFAPLAPAPQVAAAGSSADLPDGLRFTGVIRSGGHAQALIQLKDQSGPVCVGPRGYCPGAGLPALLPPGWSVTAIDVQNGRLALREGSQRRILSL
jgi:hypothetical protein